jgi:hypothetical protein
MENDYFLEIKTFLDFFNDKLRFYQNQITTILIKKEVEESKLRLLKRLNTYYNNKINDKQEQNKLHDLQVKKIEKLICKICLENTSQCIIEPCMHYCCCMDCINKMTNNICPICRTPFTNYLKIFF